MKRSFFIRSISMAVIFLATALPASAQGFGAYAVDKSGSTWVLSIKGSPATRTIRIHTSSSYAPYVNYDVTPKDNINISPGQWVEGLEGNSWTLLSDADHR